MAYFNTRDIAAISLCAALWGVLNVMISPLFWSLTRLPFACDLIGFTCLIIGVGWSKKFGVATLVGVIATIINLLLRPSAPHFVGFTAASILFDVLSRGVGYDRLYHRRSTSFVGLTVISLVSGGFAGFIIGNMFIDPVVNASVYGTPFLFAGLHALGGLVGGILGFLLMEAIQIRGVLPRTSETVTQVGS